jgi:Tfp pilus assembly protein PilO
MNVVEELQSLDVNDVGRWPFAFRAAVIAIVFVLVVGVGVYFTIVKDKHPQLVRAEEDEKTLKVTFQNKQKKAANYDAYKEQLAQIEQSFGTMLRQLPGETEIPSLIVDISPAWPRDCRKNCFSRSRRFLATSMPRSRSRFAFPAAIMKWPSSSAASPRCRAS